MDIVMENLTGPATVRAEDDDYGRVAVGSVKWEENAVVLHINCSGEQKMTMIIKFVLEL